MKEVNDYTDEELRGAILRHLEIANQEDNRWKSWYRQMNADLATVYQNEQKRRQEERHIRALEELTDVIRRKKRAAK